MLDNIIKVIKLFLLFFVISEHIYAMNPDNNFSVLCSLYNSKNHIIDYNKENINSNSRNFDWGFGLNYNIAIQPERTFYTINAKVGSETISISKNEKSHEKQEINLISISPIGLTLQTNGIFFDNLSLVFYAGLSFQCKYTNTYTPPLDLNSIKYIYNIRRYGANLDFRTGTGYLIGENTRIQLGIDLSFVPFFNSIKEEETPKSDVNKELYKNIRIFTSKIGGYILIEF